MKKITLLALAVALSGAIDVYGADVPVLDLDGCLSIALAESPTVKVADMEVKRVDYSKREIIGQLLPSVDFGGQYSRTLAKQTTYMNMDGFGDFGGGDCSRRYFICRYIIKCFVTI